VFSANIKAFNECGSFTNVCNDFKGKEMQIHFIAYYGRVDRVFWGALLEVIKNCIVMWASTYL
jgi:hypothetical protein